MYVSYVCSNGGVVSFLSSFFLSSQILRFEMKTRGGSRFKRRVDTFGRSLACVLKDLSVRVSVSCLCFACFGCGWCCCWFCFLCCFCAVVAAFCCCFIFVVEIVPEKHIFRRFLLLKSLELLALVMAFVGICGVVVVVIFSVCFGLEIALRILIFHVF